MKKNSFRFVGSARETHDRVPRTARPRGLLGREALLGLGYFMEPSGGLLYKVLALHIPPTFLGDYALWLWAQASGLTYHIVATRFYRDSGYSVGSIIPQDFQGIVAPRTCLPVQGV